MEVYQNHQLIYRSGKFEPSHSNRYWVIRSHLIQLESIESAENNTIFLRIYSSSDHIGLEGGKVWLGSLTGLVKTAIKMNLVNFILGTLFSFFGLFSIFIYFRRRKQKLYIVLSFGAFAICVGVGHISGSLVAQLSTRAIGLRYYLTVAPALLWPVGLYIFVEQILGRGYKRLIRRIWQVHILFATVGILLDAIGVFPVTLLIPLFFGLLMVGIFIGLPISVKAALKGNFEARILGVGMGIMMLSGMHDILAAFGVIPTERSFFSWSTLVFILLLGYILEHRFSQARDQLEEYSLTLEQKARTVHRS